MKLLTERSEEKFWSSFNFFSSFFIYKSAGCRQSIFFTHIAKQTIFFTHIWEQTIFWGQLGKQTFFLRKNHTPPQVLNSLPLILDHAIPHMKGLSEYFQNITKLKLSLFTGNHGNR